MAEKNRKGVSLLDEVLERRMLLYVLAAGATLAGASAAQAKVVFTHSHVELGGRNDHLNIDLNNDGKVDFQLSLTSQITATYYFERLQAKGATGNSVIDLGGSSGRNVFALALTKGAQIGSSANFLNRGLLVNSRVGSYVSGYFAYTSDRYLGVRFLINGQTHYGWIGFRKVVAGLSNNYHLKAQIQGWAYETVPNMPIIAGDKGLDDSATLRSVEPTSLELLAMGHTAIADRQRRIAVQVQS